MPPRKKRAVTTSDSQKPVSLDVPDSSPSNPSVGKPALDAQPAASASAQPPTVAADHTTDKKPSEATIESPAVESGKSIRRSARISTKQPTNAEAEQSTDAKPTKSLLGKRSRSQFEEESKSEAVESAPVVETVSDFEEDEIEVDADDRSHWHEWKNIFFIGTEWESYNQIFDFEWNFDHLHAALQEGGELANFPHPVYLFGATEPKLVSLSRKHPDKQSVRPVPVIVAILCQVKPPSLIGIKSVMKTDEVIVPMKELKIDWLPYYPAETSWSKDVMKLKTPKYFMLGCTSREAGRKHLKIESIKNFDYANPYILIPRIMERDEVQPITEVTFFHDRGTYAIPINFDWEMDELAEYTEQLKKDYEDLKDEDLEAIKENIKSHVRDAKTRIRQEKEERLKKLDSLTPKQREAYNAIKLIKYYPKSKFPDISGGKSTYVNRYYGSATQIY